MGDRRRTSEWWLRCLAAVAILYFQLQGVLGLSWDIQWHASVGRDAFLTPPHVLLYTSVAFSGLICLGVVLLETLRYRRGAGVHDGNAVRVLGLFHAPLGFFVVGFGNLTTALAAPLDNYWHELYGLDVALWAPFHIMGLLGGLIAGLGSVYLWSAFSVEEARSRRLLQEGVSSWRQPETWAILLGLVLLLGLMLTVARPALQQQFRTIELLGTLHVVTYPLLLAIGVPWLFLAANRVTAKPGAAGVVVLLLAARDLLLQLFVPWAVRTGAAAEGLPFRDPSLVPSFSFAPLLFDLGLLAVAVILGLLVWRSRNEKSGRRGWWSSPAALGMVAGAGLYLVSVPLAGLHLFASAGWTALLLTAPIALGLGALSGLLGDGLAQVWSRNPR